MSHTGTETQRQQCLARLNYGGGPRVGVGGGGDGGVHRGRWGGERLGSPRLRQKT